ncbi:MAG TPA: hypothetical protein VGH40_06775 [Roseiarcus sp.]|jgi:hypothetical protein
MRGRIVRFSAVRCGALLVALSLPLGGCLEELGTNFNRGPSVDPATLCPGAAYSHGETVGYGCPPAPNAPRP